MLTITPRLDAKTVAAYCQKYGKPYSEAFYLYLAENRGEVQAAGLFEVGGDRVTVAYFEALDQADYFLFDGVLRAGLNYAAEQGVENGRIPERFRTEHKELFDRLNYPVQPDFNITNFFQKYKNCGRVG